MRAALALFATLSLAGLAHADALDTLEKSEKRTHDAWQKLPLTERKWSFVTEPAKGYGMYQERQSNIFKPGEKIITYVEPIGYGWKPLANAMFELSFDVDLTLKDSQGTIVFEKQGFLSNVSQSHNAGMEYFLNFTLTATGLPAGLYAVTYTLHDRSGDQSSSFDQDFRISAE